MWAVREGFGDGVYMRVWDQVSVPRGMPLTDISISRSPEKRNHTGNIYSHTHFSTHLVHASGGKFIHKMQKTQTQLKWHA